MNYQTLSMEGNASSPQPGLVNGSSSPGRSVIPVEDQISAAPITRQVQTTSPQSFTPRSLIVGLIIGALITFSNTYFGLQTGWISTMAMPSALIGFSVFKVLSNHLSFPFTPIENVLIQTVAGAVGTMPLGCGFVGVIPALEFLLRDGEDGPTGDGGEGEGGPLKLGFWKLVIWSLGVCLFGVVFAVPLRKEVIVREKLRFPSGTASALMLRVLHGAKNDEKIPLSTEHRIAEPGEQIDVIPQSQEREEQGFLLKDGDNEDQALQKKDWRSKMRLLIGAFAVSGFYTLFSYFVPFVRDIPLFGVPLAHNWLWTLNPSPAYVGQGIIMGPSTCMHMLFGAVLGWGVLSPLAKARGWAPGPVDSWEDGSKAWIVWVSLAIMLADSLVSLGWLVAKPLVNSAPRWIAFLRSTRLGRWLALRLQSSEANRHSYINYSSLDSDQPLLAHETHGNPPTQIAPGVEEDEDAPPSQLISNRTVAVLLPLTLILNVICMHIVFGDIMSPLLSSLATILAVLLSIMGVRALGETDLNPVSGISKLTQLIFSLATPSSHFSRRTALVTNLLAGAVSESGALQAGDMMQDLKTGHLLGASPKAQFYGQMIGSLVGAVLSTAVYKMYVNVYEVPGDMFQTPTAYVWIFTARLVTGQGLPEMAWQASVIAGIVWMILTALRIAAASPAFARNGKPPAWRDWIPGGIAVAVGIFNVPSFTLARAIGGVIAWWWSRSHQTSSADQATHNEIANGSQAPTDAHGVPTSAEQAAEKADAASSTVVVLASGLILGEGIMSIINLLLASGKMPHL
ncbi:hypothetical protein N7462_005713 [Penicillium macrosclerotiorum]|uniref:uncharacterized protein n=1 Tax=Penicillium macrosclerotiorum TaxID=303699 RepID=UPI002549275C|nr:uncharacterized protein N7462_005713 [Penicillium macrosclerotiorum]KAJ5682548.1 hypothetical protein N7462_005713 [Penicillium macrosclerotiorum]